MSKSKYDHHFSIDRSIWLNGFTLVNPKVGPLANTASSLLRVEDDRMCCLGIYAHSLGVSKRVLNGKGYLSTGGIKLPPEANWLFNFSTLLKSENGYTNYEEYLTDINDEARLNNKKREEKIKEVFARNRIRVTFKGKYPEYASRKGRNKCNESPAFSTTSYT